MATIRVIARVDEHHRLSAEVPADIPAGPIEVTIDVPGTGEDEIGHAWAEQIAREWADDLADERQDIYTLDDGEPIASRYEIRRSSADGENSKRPIK